jgi:hypothetical protein
VWELVQAVGEAHEELGRRRVGRKEGAPAQVGGSVATAPGVQVSAENLDGPVNASAVRLVMRVP